MIFLPIGDEPNSHTRVPWMNYALIGMNVAAYLLALSHGMGEGGYSAERYGEFVLRWAYDPADPAVATLFTSMFLHGGLAHLAGNMLFLWIFGDNVESRLGAFGYLVSYLCLGALSTLTFGYFNAGIELPLIGASGAISGVQGLYWVACPRHKVKIFVWLFIIIVTVIRVNARWIMVFWFFMQDALPILVGHGPAGDNVAHVAHLGGFVGGLGLMLLIRMFFPGMDRIEDEERGRAGQYKGGHAAARRYEHVRRRDPYGPRSGRTPPSARAASTPPPRSGSTPPPRSGSTPPPLPPPLPPPGHDES